MNKRKIYSVKPEGGDKMKKVIFWILALLATVLMAGIVYGVLSIDLPDANEYVKGAAYRINGTGHTGAGNCSNITIDYRISGASTYTLIGYNTTTANDNITYNWQFNSTGGFDTNPLRDDTTYSIRARCYNNTDGALLATATEVAFKIDNKVPSCTHSQLSKTTYNPEQTWTVTAGNASSVILQFGSNSPFTMTEGAYDLDTFTYKTAEGQLPEGTYDPLRATASDGLNSTICDLSSVRIDSEAKLVQTVALISSQGQKQTQTTNGNNKTTIALVILGIVAIWYVRNNK